jgi:rod shape determining protein RodA
MRAAMKYQAKPSRYRWYIIDPILITLLIVDMAIGLFVLYSGSNQDVHLVMMQAFRMLFCFGIMWACAYVKPTFYEKYSPYIFAISLVMILSVVVFGVIDKGARRWLTLGSINFQPSEILLITVPMILAYIFSEKGLPPKAKTLWHGFLFLMIPALLVIKQPDLGTGLIILISGLCIFILIGMSWRIFFGAFMVLLCSTPILWHAMHAYQKKRILTFLHPESDPLGSGYHIIQSKIAIGSGGWFGKGWLHGTQAHFAFLPEHSTDFIFAVVGEEMGFIFCMLYLILLALIFIRCIFLSLQAQTNYTRILSAALSINFLLCALINIAMVTGLLPVVGVPLSLVSHGGSSILSTLVAFGIILSCTKHKQFIDK